MNKVALDRTDKLYWNGKPVSPAQLDKLLTQSRNLLPRPWILLETEMGPSCAALEAVRDQIQEHFDCSTKYECNEGIMTVWDNAPVAPATKVP
ncbi:hypothetical protein [Sphingomonas adhaesiva]|uniref:hypothetical protein n=1 Tax=Sphingomonas adhaesiva TaxID=28212 RepID=UPI002FF54C5A